MVSLVTPNPVHYNPPLIRFVISICITAPLHAASHIYARILVKFITLDLQTSSIYTFRLMQILRLLSYIWWNFHSLILQYFPCLFRIWCINKRIFLDSFVTFPFVINSYLKLTVSWIDNDSFKGYKTDEKVY